MLPAGAAAELSGTLRELARTGPSLSNAQTPVQTVNAPSLDLMVLPVTVTFLALAQTLMAASGAGLTGSTSVGTPRGTSGGPIVR